MADWQSNAMAVGALVSAVVVVLGGVDKLTRSNSRLDKANAMTSAMLLLALIVATMVFDSRLGAVAVVGVQVLWLSVFFMLNPNSSKVDVLLLTIIWPLFFWMLSFF